ncbi:hypothetical protein CPC08DRAFT_762844 [Agrocybe pediades]|nr:hypothetical protein CPC08DRAFT_762844 [Agrocybe pediades]
MQTSEISSTTSSLLPLRGLHAQDGWLPSPLASLPVNYFQCRCDKNVLDGLCPVPWLQILKGMQQFLLSQTDVASLPSIIPSPPSVPLSIDDNTKDKVACYGIRSFSLVIFRDRSSTGNEKGYRRRLRFDSRKLKARSIFEDKYRLNPHVACSSIVSILARLRSLSRRRRWYSVRKTMQAFATLTVSGVEKKGFFVLLMHCMYIFGCLSVLQPSLVSLSDKPGFFQASNIHFNSPQARQDYLAGRFSRGYPLFETTQRMRASMLMSGFELFLVVAPDETAHLTRACVVVRVGLVLFYSNRDISS